MLMCWTPSSAQAECRTDRESSWLCQGDLAWQHGYLVSKPVMSRITKTLLAQDQTIQESNNLLEQYSSQNRVLWRNGKILHQQVQAEKRKQLANWLTGMVVGIIAGAAGAGAIAVVVAL